VPLYPTSGGLFPGRGLRRLLSVRDQDKSELNALKVLKGQAAFFKLHQAKGKTNIVADNGAVGDNKVSFTHVGEQREAAWQLRYAEMARDGTLATRASTAIQYAFAQMNAGGWFNNGLGATNIETLEADTFFLQWFTNAYLLVSSDRDLQSLANSYSAYGEHLSLAMAWIESQKATIYSQGDDTPNRLLFASGAFYMGSRILGSTTYRNTGQQFLELALDLFHEDGYFLEKGGYDSSYQGVCIFNLCFLYLHSTDMSLRAALRVVIESAVDWLITRITSSGAERGYISHAGNSRTGPDGELTNGRPKLVNYAEVALALYYSAYILDRADLAQTGYNVVWYLAYNT
jgi:hypothetical protein